MPLWAGIDEAGYGPLLGPLVVASTVFRLPGKPRGALLWQLLEDAVTRSFKTADGRLVVNDSKLVYKPARGVRTLEEGVLGFLGALGVCPSSVEELERAVSPVGADATDDSPWFREVGRVALPRESNPSAIASKSAALVEACRRARVEFLGARASIVLPREFNRFVRLTRNKSYLLFQRCGLLLQHIWDVAEGEEVFVLVDRHGGRLRYRKLLKDVFPECACDIVREGDLGSIYRISDESLTMWVAFKEQADRLELPVSLASMVAKYMRELYMIAFNSYWQARMKELRPTAGYVKDGRRFLKDIAPLLKQDGADMDSLVRRL